MLDRHIFIIGMPGSGKSSLGKRVAKELGVPFTDTDELVARTIDGTVNDFFTRYGEQAFRKAETNMLTELTRARPMIVSTGGGTVINPVNRKIMRNWGIILLNDRPLEDILGDIKLDRRPTLREGGLDAVREVYETRYPVYRSAADLILRNDQGYQAAVVNMIRMIRERFGV